MITPSSYGSSRTKPAISRAAGSGHGGSRPIPWQHRRSGRWMSGEPDSVSNTTLGISTPIREFAGTRIKPLASWNPSFSMAISARPPRRCWPIIKVWKITRSIMESTCITPVIAYGIMPSSFPLMYWRPCRPICKPPPNSQPTGGSLTGWPTCRLDLIGSSPTPDWPESIYGSHTLSRHWLNHQPLHDQFNKIWFPLCPLILGMRTMFSLQSGPPVCLARLFDGQTNATDL